MILLFAALTASVDLAHDLNCAAVAARITAAAANDPEFKGQAHAIIPLESFYEGRLSTIDPNRNWDAEAISLMMKRPGPANAADFDQFRECMIGYRASIGL